MSSQEMDSLVRILRECSKGRPPPIYKPLLKTSRWTVMVGCVLGSMEKFDDHQENTHRRNSYEDPTVQIKSDMTIVDHFLRCLLERYYQTYLVAPQSLGSQQQAVGTPKVICHLLMCFSIEGHQINPLTPEPLRRQHRELQGTTKKVRWCTKNPVPPLFITCVHPILKTL
jgi:hypothetical protein